MSKQPSIPLAQKLLAAAKAETLFKRGPGSAVQRFADLLPAADELLRKGADLKAVTRWLVNHQALDDGKPAKQFYEMLWRRQRKTSRIRRTPPRNLKAFEEGDEQDTSKRGN